MTVRTTGRALARITLTVALLVGAAAIWSLMPSKLESWAPIAVRGSVGERIVGRDLAVTVHSVTLARSVTFDDDGEPTRLEAKSAWLVIVLSYEPLTRPASPDFELRAGGRIFESSLNGFGSAQPGLAERGPLAFDLPEAPTDATLYVSNETIDDKYGLFNVNAPLDSQVVVKLELDTAPEDVVDLERLQDQ